MEGGIGLIIMTGLALISLGYGWVMVLGVFGLMSVLLIIGGVGTLMSSLMLSAISKFKDQTMKGSKVTDPLEW